MLAKRAFSLTLPFCGAILSFEININGMNAISAALKESLMPVAQTFLHAFLPLFLCGKSFAACCFYIHSFDSFKMLSSL